jgi:hypothetical protein
METGKLTPRTNSTVSEMRFTGNFGLPGGFGSVLTAGIRRDGRAVLTLTYTTELDGRTHEHMWSVELDNEQRRVLGALLASYEPTLWEKVR